MKLIVISLPAPAPNEHEIINSLLEEGLEMFQIHKPSFSKEEIKDFIQQISTKHQNKIFLHSDFSKFHSLSPPPSPPQGRGDLFFLSPIFDSISKTGYKSKFDLQEVKSFLQKQKALPMGKGLGWAPIALGGIDEGKIETCRELGFAGVAVLGAIWNSTNPIEKFKIIQKQIMNTEQGIPNNGVEILRHS
ncbi:MAG: thiamine phosphate synthase [Bacteroidetes bacterium]|nr:thiamine phosphate synthase [Bacteroidota bacterium]